MSFTSLKKKAHSLLDEASWIAHIKSKEEYETALQLIDELMDDYDNNLAFIEILSSSIERWENDSEDFSQFNIQVKNMDQGISVLKILMEQHELGVADLPEIGSKSLVSKILNGKRKLTIDHIKSLSKRFNINPGLFFSSL